MGKSSKDFTWVCDRDVGFLLAHLRRSKGLTLREVESATGISNGHISRIECGWIRSPSLRTMVLLFGLYGYPLLPCDHGVAMTRKQIKRKAKADILTGVVKDRDGN